MLSNTFFRLDNLQFSQKCLPLQCVFHSIRFKVNKGWSTAVLLFFYARTLPPYAIFLSQSNNLVDGIYLFLKEAYLYQINGKRLSTPYKGIISDFGS